VRYQAGSRPTANPLRPSTLSSLMTITALPHPNILVCNSALRRLGLIRTFQNLGTSFLVAAVPNVMPIVMMARAGSMSVFVWPGPKSRPHKVDVLQHHHCDISLLSDFAIPPCCHLSLPKSRWSERTFRLGQVIDIFDQSIPRT